MEKENNQPQTQVGTNQPPLFSAPAAILFQAPELAKPNVVKIEPERKTSARSSRGRKKTVVEVPAEVTFAAPKIEELKTVEVDNVPSRTRKPRKKAELKQEKKPVASELPNDVLGEVVETVSFQAPPAPAEVMLEAVEKPRRGRKKNAEDGLDEANKTKNKRLRSRVVNEEDPEGYESVEEIDDEDSSHRRRRRRSRAVSKTREESDEITVLKGSTRLEAKKLRRREGRKEGRRQKAITEAEFLARREAVNRKMLVRSRDGLNQIAILEDNVLVEHYVSRHTQSTMVGSVFLGRVQNVLPSMEAAFVDLGKGRNAVLYAGEVNWDAAGLHGSPRRIEQALKSGDKIPVQVTKDPIGHKGARLTSQITLPGRYLVLVPGGAMAGISRKLPEVERKRLKRILKKIVPNDCGVIIRTAAEGATEEQLEADVKRLYKQWEEIEKAIKTEKNAPALLHSEPELSLRVVRDVFNEDFEQLLVQGRESYQQIKAYVERFAPDLIERVEQWVDKADIFAANRIDEQLAKGMDRKVWLPSGGYLIIDRTEAMTVIDVNTGKYTGSGGTLEETITRNNLEAAEEIMRQLRLRDIGGIVVIDFVDMVLESNRDLVLRRLIECLGRDRTRHQVTEVTSLGLVQMTRKRVGEGLVEAFSTVCDCCDGKGFIVSSSPVEKNFVISVKEDKNSKSKNSQKEVAAKKLQERAAKSIAQVVAATKQDSESLSESAKKKTEYADQEAAGGQLEGKTKSGLRQSSAVLRHREKAVEARKNSRRPAARVDTDIDPQQTAEERRKEAAKSVAEALNAAVQMLDGGEKRDKSAISKVPDSQPEKSKVKVKSKGVVADSGGMETRPFVAAARKVEVEKLKRKKHAAVSMPVVNPGENS